MLAIIVAAVDGHGGVKLISRNGHYRTPLFRTFRDQLSCSEKSCSMVRSPCPMTG
jgi:hypothetical protein